MLLPTLDDYPSSPQYTQDRHHQHHSRYHCQHDRVNPTPTVYRTQPTPRLNIADALPIEVNKAIKQQARIGWPLMLRGYISPAEWIVAYSALSGNNVTSKATISWSKKIINSLWTYAFNMWDHRCKLLAEDEEGLKFTKINDEIRKLYTE
jgi:hypothetical protein